MIVAEGLEEKMKELESLKGLGKKTWEAEGLSIEHLKPELISLAKMALESDAFGGTEIRPHHDWMIAIILGTFEASRNANRMEFSIKGLSVDGLRPHIDDDLDFDAMTGDPNWGVDAIDQIMEWIEEYKRLDERDEFASGRRIPTREIAYRLVYAIERDPSAFFSRNEQGKGMLDPTGLVAKTGLVPLPPDVVATKLEEILQLWAGIVETEYRFAFNRTFMEMT